MIFRTTAVLFLLATMPCLGFAESPVDLNQIESDLTVRIPGLDKVHHITKYEITEKGVFSTREKDLILYPYYDHLCFLYWEGSYGQVVREQVQVEYIKVSGQWIYDDIVLFPSSDNLLVQEPTKPLPSMDPPKNEFVEKLARDNFAPIVNKKDEFKLKDISFSSPQVERRGWDYETVVYTYPGKTTYIRHDPNDFLGLSDEHWEGPCKVVLTYSVPAKTWDCRVDTSECKETD